jgi:hypothetical protein
LAFLAIPGLNPNKKENKDTVQSLNYLSLSLLSFIVMAHEPHIVCRCCGGRKGQFMSISSQLKKKVIRKRLLLHFHHPFSLLILIHPLIFSHYFFVVMDGLQD